VSEVVVLERFGLPESTDRDAWSDEEKAAVEAAGLTFSFSYGDRRGERVLAPRAVINQFLHLAQKSGLDPRARQLYCIGRQSGGGVEWSIQTGIDGFRLVADRSGKYAGQEPAEWLTADGQWVTTWIAELHGQRDDQGRVAADAHPLAARVAVHRHDWSLPAVGIATWDEYVQRKHNGDVTAMWQARGPGQLAKCAEALALRKAFPLNLSGLYTAEELGGSVAAAAAAGDEGVAAEVVPPSQRSRVAALRPADASVAADGPVSPSDDETAADGRTAPDVADSGLFPCARCGGVAAEEEGQLCGACEVEVEAEVAAFEGGVE
jgi:phage recombination protein Bet